MGLINLHNHSSCSDGTLPPAEVAREAKKACVEYFALTDHDSVDGCLEAGRESAALGLKYCHAVEISTAPHHYLHILGYGIDPAAPGLVSFLAAQRELKIARVKKTLELLRPLGYEISFEELPWRGGCPPDTWQVAVLMSERGWAPSRSQAEKRWLGSGAPAHVHREGASVADAIGAVRAAGGRAVLAHPYTVGHCLTRDLPAWKDAGLEGMEVFYPAHTPEVTREFLALARRYGLFVTAGVDYHGPATERDKMSGFEISTELALSLEKLFIC